MIRRLQYILLVLFTAGLVYTLVPDIPDRTPATEFLEQATACHMAYRPGLEAMLTSKYNIAQVGQGCDGLSADITSEVLSGGVHVLGSSQHAHEVVFTPALFAGEVRWSCSIAVQRYSAACDTEG